MELERLIIVIVKTVIEELGRLGLIRPCGVTLSDPSVSASAAAPPAASKPLSVKQRVISAQVVLDAAKTGQRVLDIPAKALITPLAADVAREKQISFQRVGER